MSLLAIYVSLMGGMQAKMDRYSRFFLGYLTVHALHALVARTHFAHNMQVDHLAPYGLLYGPLLYYAYRFAVGKPLDAKVWLHALPFLFFALCYVLWLSVPSLFGPYEHLLETGLYHTLALSLLSYTIWALFFRRASNEAQHSELSRMVSMMGMILAFVAVLFVAVAYSNVVSGPFRVQFNRSIVFLCMLGAAIILFSNKVRRIAGGAESQREPDVPRHDAEEKASGDQASQPVEGGQYKKSAIPDDLLDTYETSLRQLVEERQVYLDDGLSSSSLAQQLKIPKHHLSQVLSLRIGKNFNTYVNEHRVAHAVKLMHTHPETSITDIYLHSGFTAKASFNRYFKQFKGCTPTEYRNGKG